MQFSSAYLTTRDAAAYCGFKTTSALRKARLEGRIQPIGRRGGRGTYMWSIDALVRFLRGEPPAILGSERSGAPLHGGADDEEEDGVEVAQGIHGGDGAGAAGRVAAKGGRTRRTRPRNGSLDGKAARDHQVASDRGRADGAEVDHGRVQPCSRRSHVSRESAAAVLRLRDIALRAQGGDEGDQERTRP